MGAPVQDEEQVAVLVRESPEQVGGSVVDQVLLGGESALVTLLGPSGQRPMAMPGT